MERISVAIRVRPPSKEELVKGNHWVIQEQEKKLSLCNCYGAPLSGYTYAFDQLFGPSSKNSYVYNLHAKDVVISALRGFNGTVFAYGQTSSGKTYTMQGCDEQPGIIRLAVRDIFESISKNPSREFLVRVSYMEIYNEEINDLLAPENRKLQIHENFEKGLFVAGLREEIVNSPDQIFDFLSLGEAHRHFGETNMNNYSSRSHTIFRMVIESKDNNKNTDSVRVSTLNLVDLAGSERVAKTGAGGVRLKEGTHINKSLMTLGTVINKLSEGPGKGGHIPYRDSKLTRILQSALDGNAKTAIICTITPDEIHIDETKGTLQFASRAKKVATCAHVNEILTDAALLKRQKKEIEELREKLLGLRSDDFEKQLLALRNDLLKYELEKEKLTLDLEEEKKSQLDREKRIKEQEQKIENLSSLVMNSARDGHWKNAKVTSRRETWSPQQVTLDGSTKECFRSPLTRLDNSLISTRRDRGRAGTPIPAFQSLLEKNADESGTAGSTPDPFRGLPELPLLSQFQTEEQATNSNGDECFLCMKLEFQLKELQVQFEDLQSRFDAKSEETEDAKKQLSLLRESCSQSNKSLEESQAEINDLRECKVLQEQRFDEIMGENHKLKEMLANLEKENKCAEMELEQARTESFLQMKKVDELVEAKTQDEHCLTAVRVENSALVEQNRRLESLLKSAQLQEQEREKELETLKGALCKANKKLDAMAKQIQSLQEALIAEQETHKADLGQLESSLQVARSKEEVEKEELKHLSNTTTALGNENKRLKLSLVQQSDALRGKETQLREMATKMSSMEESELETSSTEEVFSDSEEWCNAYNCRVVCQLEDVLLYPTKGICGEHFEDKTALNYHRLRVHHREILTMLKCGSIHGRRQKQQTTSKKYQELEERLQQDDKLPRGLAYAKKGMLKEANNHIKDQLQQEIQIMEDFQKWQQDYKMLLQENDNIRHKKKLARAVKERTGKEEQETFKGRGKGRERGREGVKESTAK